MAHPLIAQALAGGLKVYGACDDDHVREMRPPAPTPSASAYAIVPTLGRNFYLRGQRLLSLAQNRAPTSSRSAIDIGRSARMFTTRAVDEHSGQNIVDIGGGPLRI
ncbi:hypothetical protein Tco_1029695 [Tanacetum coccineum]|uniref:Uncharacterized protein n=1 Tax=Tanacetum coccineum TaxID=301880 RepID=A0ABQ5G4Q8_9ASTR